MALIQKQSHAYIQIAPSEEGYNNAYELAEALICPNPLAFNQPCGICRDCQKAKKRVHPDIITISRQMDEKGKQKREIYVDQIREIISDSAVLPNEASKKVYIIRDAGTMNTAAQNALLKVLEEPPYFVAFILVAESAGTLLETVRSRCVMLYCNAEENNLPAESRNLAEEYLSIVAAGAKVSLISFANRNGDLSNAEMRDFALSSKMLLTDMLCGRLPAMKLEKTELLRLARLMDTVEQYLQFNVSTKHVLGLLTVDSIKKL